MADSMMQFGEVVTSPSRRYTFEPQQDITAYELAQILKLVSEQTEINILLKAVDLPSGLAPALAHHFRIQDH
jgi:hypothetical protein